ncbi:probable disease resistance protein At1g58602 [Fagus crenata]
MDILSIIPKNSLSYVLYSFIFLILIIGLVFVYLGIRWFQRLEHSYKPFRRGFKLLDAIIKDVEEVSKSGKQIDEKPNQLRDSQLKSGATVELNEATKSWVDTTKAMVDIVRGYDDTYRKLTEERKDLEWIYVVFTKIRSFRTDLDKRNSEIDEKLWRAPYRICESVEGSRSIVRSLQNRPIEEDPFIYRLAEPVVSIERKLQVLMAKKPDLVSDQPKEMEYIIMFPLQLLLAFLRDLEGLTLESKTEKAWVEVMLEIIGELDDAIDSIQKTKNRMRWVPYFGHRMATRRLKERVYHITGLIYSHFYKKSTWGLTFIRRVRILKSVNLSPQQQTQPTTDDNDEEISDLREKFCKRLNQEQPKGDSPLKDLSNLCKEVSQHLIDATEAVESKHYLRKAGKNQFKSILKDAITSLSPSQSQSQRSNRSSTQKETDPWQKDSEKDRLFKHVLRILDLIITECHIEQREETNSVVGLEEDVHKLVSRLTSSSTDQKHRSILSIVGMEGIGKTTLARVIFNRGDIKEHFDEKCKYWVDLFAIVENTNDEILTKIGKVILETQKEEAEGKKKDYSVKGVKDFLKAKKYLVVLDNISSKETWDTIQEAFPDDNNGSRILLTTRDKSVALHAGSPSCDPHQLPLRTKDESLSLFKQMVHFIKSEPSPTDPLRLPAVLDKVIKRCGGLPLSILSHGYSLAGKEVKAEDLSRVLEQVNPYQTPWSDNLERNQKDLPPYLSKCLSYIGQFPRDSEISARRLQALWLVEGFTKQSGEKQEHHKSVAVKHLNELIYRNLVQIVERTRNGRAKTCVFPGALQEIWLRQNPPSLSFNEPVFYYVVESDASNINSPNIWQRYRNPHSMLCFDTREGDQPGKDIGIFIKNYISSGHLLLLKVLDLEHIFRPKLPDNIGKLVHLMYLGLRWTYLDSIPPSIGNLESLQTLDLKHTYIRNIPSSIWKLEKLEYLYMSDICRSVIDRPQRKRVLMKNLQKLRGAFVDKDSHLKEALKKMKKLQMLDLAFQLEAPEQNALAKSLVELELLQELRLKSIDEMGQAQDLQVNHLSGLVKLSTLYLFGNLKNPSIIINITGLPQSLTKLTLSASGLSHDPMPELGKLYNLQSLYFYSDSYTGKTMVCSKGGFPQLLDLKFLMLLELEEWNVEEQAMPCLQKLEIRSCKKLKVPTGLTHLNALSELSLKHMPVEFTNEIEDKKDQIWADMAVIPVIIKY